MSHSRSMSPAVEDYLKAIFRLEEDHGSSVSTNALAAWLGVRQASISGMLRKLDDLGFISYQAYRGFSLTDAGRIAAVSVIRRHRLLELFLSEVLDVPWDEVHDEAELLEHALSPKLCDLIASKLGDPLVDPHGDPIPPKAGAFVEPVTASLESAGLGETHHLVRVSDQDPAVLRNLSARGVGLGTEFIVLDHYDDGSISLGLGDTTCTLDADVVRAMRVEL